MNQYVSLTEAQGTLDIGTSTLRLWIRKLGIERQKLPHDRRQTFISVQDLENLKSHRMCS